MIFYEWVERRETWKAWDLLYKKKKMFFEKYTLLIDTSFFVFFKIFISFYQVKLGCLDLVWVDCRKFCALFFCLFVAFLIFSLCTFIFLKLV